MKDKKKIIVISGPSGCGKTTSTRYLCSTFPDLHLSISCTTRKPRGEEIDGQDYHFISVPEFKTKEEGGEFLETQEVYPGLFYGTLKSEVPDYCPCVFDIDVHGAKKIKEYYGDSALYILLCPPSLSVLEKRIRERGENTEDEIKTRLEKAKSELIFSSLSREQGKPDYCIKNDDLGITLGKIKLLVSRFLNPDYPHIFLDIDGVLNSEAWFNSSPKKDLSDPIHSFDPQAVGVLLDVLDQTQSFLVISSSWRMQVDLEKIFRKLGLPDLFDTTPYLYYEDPETGKYELRNRGEEIQAYIKEHGVQKYCILDDDYDFLESQEPHILHTSWLRGLLRDDIEKIIKILNI